jgi:hypothetical protein
MIKIPLIVFASTVMCIGFISPASSATNCEIGDIKFSAEDKSVLEDIKGREENAAVAGFIVDWVPLALLFTADNSLDLLYSFVSTDWDLASGASGNFAKIACDFNKSDLDYHYLSLQSSKDRKRKKFFKCLRDAYIKKCVALRKS